MIVRGLAARQRTDDWEQKYPYRPVLIETCVDTARFSGSAYKAAGWERIGSTQHRASKSRKDVYWKPLTTDFKPILRTMPRTPAPKSARDDLRRGAEIDDAITRPCRLVQTLITAAARFPGSAYKAAGWERIGSTQHRASKSRKDVYWKPLTTDFKPILRMMPRTPAPKSARDDLRRGAEIDDAITRPCRLVQTLITAAARFPGSAYKAAGWERIGSTQHRASKSRKDVDWKPLTTDFKPILKTAPRTPAPKSTRDDLRRGTEIDEAITRPCRLVQALITAAARFRRVMPRTMTPTGRPAVLSQGRAITPACGSGSSSLAPANHVIAPNRQGYAITVSQLGRPCPTDDVPLYQTTPVSAAAGARYKVQGLPEPHGTSGDTRDPQAFRPRTSGTHGPARILRSDRNAVERPSGVRR